jgi:hypothetical protein
VLDRIVNRAIAIIVVADGAVEIVILEYAVEGLALRHVGSLASVTTFIPAAAFLEHARTSFPSSSTMQVSQVSIGPMAR